MQRAAERRIARVFAFLLFSWMVILPVENRLFAQAGAVAAQTESKTADTPDKLPKFEVASIRIIPENEVNSMLNPLSPPGAQHFIARNLTIASMIGVAFGISDSYRVLGAPAWNKSTHYEIQAKPEGDVGVNYKLIRPCLQQLLQERFHLTYHRETKTMKVYALEIAKGGPKLSLKKDRVDNFGGLYPDRMKLIHMNMTGLTANLEELLGEMVVDETGLKGDYDVDIQFAPINSTDSDKPSIFTVLEEQLGLKLEKRMAPVEIFVIDHVDREPTPN